MKSLWMACIAMVGMTGTAAFAGGTADSASQESAAGAEVAPVAQAAWIPSPTAITPAAADAYAYDDLSQQVDIEFWSVGWLRQPDPDDDPIRKMFEEELNITLTVQFLSNPDLISKLTLRAAADDVPDLLFNSGDKANVQKLVDQGFFLTDYDPILDQYGPTLKQSIGSFARISVTKDGVLQFIPKGPENADDIWYYCIRKDWLANLGLEMPTNDREFLEVLKQFTFNDPDGNGKDDTWGTTSNGGKTGPGRAMTMFAVLFGNNTKFGLEDGAVSHPMVNGAQRQMLESVKEIVDAQVIDPDWYTQDWNQQKNNLLTGRIGAVVYPVTALIAESEAANGNDGSTLGWWTWVPLMNAVGPMGDAARERMWWTYPGAYWAISTKAGDDEVKLKRVMHFLDYMQYPNRGYYITEGGYGVLAGYNYRGTPGERWTLEAGSVDPRRENPGWTALYDWRRNNTVGSLYNATPVPTFADQLAERTHNLRQEMQAAANANAANYYERTDLLLNLDPKTVTNLKDLVSRNDILFVTGQRSFDEWDDYVAEWRQGGGDALLAEAESQYRALGMID
jgi:putative aldouronate transport system substrate-binding protein